MTLSSKKRREARLQAESRAVAAAEHLLGKIAPELVAKQCQAGLSREDCESLLQQVQAAIEPRHWKAARKYLRKRLKELEQATGGFVYPPAPATYIRRDKSPMAGDAMALVGELEVLIERFFVEIRENLNAPEPTAESPSSSRKSSVEENQKGSERKAAENERKYRLRTVGRIVFSAIVNGGLLNQGLYRKFLPELCDGVQAHDKLAWISFPLDDDDPDDDEETDEPDIDFDAPVRRWFLDPVTLGLYTRWCAVHSEDERRAVIARTKVQNALVHYLKYLRTLPMAGQDLQSAAVSSPTALFRAATARISLYLPPVLVNFLRSTVNGQSMSERTWWRYQYELVVDTPDLEPEESDATTGLAATEEPRKNQYTGDRAIFFQLQEDLLKVLQQSLGDPTNRKKADKNGPAVKRIEAVLEKRQADMAPLLYAFYRWILWKLKLPSKKKGRIRCSSARRYVSRLGQAMIALGAELTMEEMGSSEWENFYEELIESLVSAIDQNKAAGNLRDFHRFLMISFDAPPAAINGEVDATARGRSTLISEQDYQHLMKVLTPDGSPSHQVQVLRIIAMLMFRAGLRPNELIGLEYRHIQGAPLERLSDGSADPILYLHATSRAVIKTPSGVRQIPLAWFLDAREMKEFQAYLHARLSLFKENRTNAVILSPSLGTRTQLSEKEYLGTLTDLLREITGDPNVVAYTLRHGCLSNTFHTLFSPDLESTHAFLRSGLLPREAMYAISTLGGHLDPDISLQSYIHTQDIVCHLHLRELQKDLPIGIRAVLEDKSEASLYQRRARLSTRPASDSDPSPEHVVTMKKLIEQLSIDAPKARPASEIDLPEFRSEVASLLDLDIETIHALLVSFQRKLSREARARLFSLPDAQIERFKKLCLRLADYKTKSTASTRNLRNLKPLKKRSRLPDLYRRAQPGKFGPAPPHHSREEMNEANRIYRLLASRASELNMDRTQVMKSIVEPISDLLLAHSGSEAVIRTVNAEKFAGAIRAIRSLNIQPDRIEIEIEALPRVDDSTPDEWIRCLRELAKSRKLRVSESSRKVTRRSQAHPNFGIVKIRVLALSGPGIGELRQKARKQVADRAGAGWRVGCFYAVTALTAVLSAIK